MPARCAALLACAALAACSPPQSKPPVADHEAGRQIYNFRCYFCHGYSGDSRTLAASMIEPPPRDFTRARGLDERRVLAALRQGVPGTAMASFDGTLTPREMELVARFVIVEFVQSRAPNARYHTAANGWPQHERYAAAFPFAAGEIALDRPEALLSAKERAGKALFMGACISCHDRGRVVDTGAPWQSGLDANQVAPGARH